MKKFWTLFRMSILDAFEYRGDMFVFVISGISQPIVLMAMWLGVIASGGSTPMSHDGIIQYYLVFLVVSLWTSAWASVFITSKIRLGNLSPYLLHPVHYFCVLLTENLGEKAVKFLLIIPVVIIVYSLFKPIIPSFESLTTILFLLSVLLATVMVFCFDVIMGLMAFWLDETSAVEFIYDIFLLLFSGRLIPVIALPKLIQEVGFYLPFRYSLSFPIEILLRQVKGPEIYLGFALQIIWATVSLGLMWVLWNRGIKRYSASGA